MNGMAAYADVQLFELDDNAQIEQYTPLVKRIAYHLMSRLPPSVQQDDLIQAGLIGLRHCAIMTPARVPAFKPTHEFEFAVPCWMKFGRMTGRHALSIARQEWFPKWFGKSKIEPEGMRETTKLPNP